MEISLIQHFKIMKEKHFNLAYLLLTLLCFKFIYGLSIIDPTNINWLMSAYHDWGQHYLGWAFFRQENWTFPLGTIQNYNYPAGSNVGLTDSIPLLAFFFKLFDGILPTDFQYFGLWFLSCHLLLTYYTVKLLRLFKASDYVLIAAVLLISLNPTLLYRGMHPALCAHWMIVACFYNYFRSSTTDNTQKVIYHQIFLLLFSAAVHPYLLVIVAAFNCILPLKMLLDKKISVVRFGVYVIVPFLLVLVIWYLTGLIRFGDNTALEVANSYGLFSTNLNAFFNAQGFSRILPQMPFHKVNQYEGFAYLGVGFMILLVFSVVYKILFWKKTWNFRIDRNKVLFLIVIAVFTFFAITHLITLNEKLLLEIPMPDSALKIGNIFRASGRFIWPLYYAFLFFILIFFSKLRINRFVQIGVLSAVLVVQVYDISPMMFRYKDSGSYVSKKIDQQGWIDMTSSFKKIITFPPFENNLQNALDYQDLCFVALKNKMAITCGYVARDIGSTNNEFKKGLEKQLTEASIDPNNIYVTTQKYIDAFYPLIESGNVTVKEHDGYFCIYSNKSRIRRLSRFSDKTAELSQKVHKELKVKVETGLVFSNDIVKYNFDVKLKSEKTLNLQGWAFFSDLGIRSDSVKVGLVSQDKAYFAQTNIFERPDLVDNFKSASLLKSGFKSTIFLNQIPLGKYNLVIGLKSNQGWSYQKLEDEIDIKEQIVPKRIQTVPSETGNVIGNLDDFKQEKDKIEVSGWAAIENEDCNGITHELILIGDTNCYMIATDNVIRRDVSDHFKVGSKYNKSGYSVQIQKSSISKGTYKVGIRMLRENNVIGFKIITENKIIN
ncbi:DUF6311 domain-containing protein [Flavobacterium silvaticum]|uniref:Glycosyltransferase RgtA/B/C/D-like domain-containing protein n=1 Tax=Flavobacterium silvaticum TaxID=1852020 RepID=A0A972FNA3_9FLAO|nr:DUF6311 domain-containing protein [Flavobacterium silvaticum]NMH28390.1 hypothetical protein [Flavobacterium silvaticum]